ncbi:sulfatase [Candidatus Omnitrophota bacterium]
MKTKLTLKLFFLLLLAGPVIIGIGFPRSAPKADLPNIILIIADSLRPDHLGCYGYGRNTSPNIDQLAKQGVIFREAISAGGWTCESIPSILTGTYSLTHQIRDWDDLRNISIETVASQLSSKEYQCVILSNHRPVKLLDIRDGFQEVYISDNFEDKQPVINAQNFTDRVIAWLKAYTGGPFFLFIHYHSPHFPYRPPEPYKSLYLFDKFMGKSESVPISDSRNNEAFQGINNIPYLVAEDNITDPNYYISQYDGAIAYLDAQIGRLLESLEDIGLDKNTLIIVTADHGEMLGEHNIYFTHQKGYEEDIRVPLIIRFTKLLPQDRAINRQVSLIDLAPTILEIAGLGKPSYMQGESLLAFIRPLRIYHAKYAFSSNRDTLVLRSKEWKLISDDWADELYNLKQDPGEQHNLAGRKLSKLLQLKKRLNKLEEEISSPIISRNGRTITEKEKEYLRSLGYF